MLLLKEIIKMQKPTIFFSHSTKDSENLIVLRDRVEMITGGTIKIFMSSDGQSIPLGHNWIHKIEQGLEAASIMFVFVTPNSISSNWIYFEAGFAYSKGIEVIPVGLGIDISKLSAPLSMLQGFNLISEGSLNNFIATINKKFLLKFSESFTNEDFKSLIQNRNENTLELPDCFENIETKIYAEYGISNSEEKITYDLDSIFLNTVKYLRENNIAFSLYEPKSLNEYNQEKKLVFMGVKLSYVKKSVTKQTVSKINQNDYLEYSFSPFNFEESVKTFNDMMSKLSGKEWVNLLFNLNQNYCFLIKEESVSAIISQYPDFFRFEEKHVGSYHYDNIHFSIPKGEKHLQINYQTGNFSVKTILELISKLLEIKLIREK